MATTVIPLPAITTGAGTLALPKVSDGFGPTKRGGRGHFGVDMMYKRDPHHPQSVGDGAGSRRHVMPPGTSVLAAWSGTVTHASRLRSGLRVRIDHAASDLPPALAKLGNISSGYFHLSSARVKPGDEVEAGDIIGLVGHSPAGTDPLHLHFDIRSAGHAVDPAVYWPDSAHARTADNTWPAPRLSSTLVPVASNIMAGRRPPQIPDFGNTPLPRPIVPRPSRLVNRLLLIAGAIVGVAVAIDQATDDE